MKNLNAKKAVLALTVAIAAQSAAAKDWGKPIPGPFGSSYSLRLGAEQYDVAQTKAVSSFDQGKRGRLVIIETPAELKWILNAYLGAPTRYVRVGAVFDVSRWVWTNPLNGKKIPFTGPWCPGAPDNYRGKESTVVIDGPLRAYEDVSPNGRYAFLIEFQK